MSQKKYAVISYSKKNKDDVENELRLYDDEKIHYWYDKEMVAAKNYEKEFIKALDLENCKGAIFFISEEFFLSQPCINELEYFIENYGAENPNKFCVFVLPKNFSRNANEIFDRVLKHVEDNALLEKMENREKSRFIDRNVSIFSDFCRNNKIINGILNKGDDYIKRSCRKGHLFDAAGIISEYAMKGIVFKQYGYFPQSRTRGKEEIDIKQVPVDTEQRYLDKRAAYYAPVKWIVIEEDDDNITLLSENLLLSIDYLDIKYPLNKNEQTVSQYLSGRFREYFKPDENIDEIRFVSQSELNDLLKRCTDDKEKQDILNPEATFFAQATNNENVPIFWLAGDTEDASRVDSGISGLSELKPGTETYYIRVVINVAKNLN